MIDNNFRGKNVYPQDLEWAAQSAHSLVRPGSCVAFAHKKESENEIDSIIILAEVRRELSSAEREFVTNDIKQVLKLSTLNLKKEEITIILML